MRITIVLLSGAALAGISGAALAQDHTGYAAIATGEYAKAERTLVAERRIFPERPALMLNLAAVYRHTGRTTEARTLYQAVLDRPDELMDMPDSQIVGSHALADAGMQLLTTQSIASR